MKIKKICACGCGGEIIWKPYMKYYGVPKYLRGHQFKDKTYKEKRQLKLKNNPEIKKNAIKKYKQTLKDNPKIIKQQVKKRKQTYKNNPEIQKNASEKYKNTIKNNPEIIIGRTKIFRQTIKDNPKIIEQQIKNRKQTLKDNPRIMDRTIKKRKKTLKDDPKITIKQIKRFKQTLKDNPEIKKNAIKKLKQTLKDNPEILIRRVKKRQQTYKNNPEIQKNANKKGSATKQGIDVKDWKKFIGKEPYDQNWTPQFRRAIRKRDNQICMLCGRHKEKLKYPLAIHHINYDKKMSIYQNCISLCGSCHANTQINRNYWIKFFQSLLFEKYDYQYGENQEVIINLEEAKNE